MQLQAPIEAVTVHPQRARVTRRGRVALEGGAAELVVADLPVSLLDDSVRVAGRSAVPVRVLGVDLRHRDLAEVPDDRVRAAEERVRDAERTIAEIDDLDAADAARAELLVRLARRSGNELAAALADGRAGTARVAEVGSVVAAQLVEVAALRRAHAERRTAARHELAAAAAELDRLRGSGRQRREAVIGVEADGPGEFELELSYVVLGAGWAPAYDARLAPAPPPQPAGGTAPALAPEQVELTWFGMITQATGEDWPECALTLSTARPAVASRVPELDPWWIDVSRPPPPVMAAGPAPMRRERAFAAAAAADAVEVARPVAATPVLAEPEEPAAGAVAGSWRLARPTAVPADGTPHRTTITAFALPARLDHVVAPALGPEVHLRATVTNTSGRVLLAGPVSTFTDEEFVGTTALALTAPGAEIELALGVDDRVVAERELADRTAHRARFGSSRSWTERWTITVQNRRPAPARVLVRDRLPVSRHADISVVDVALSPEPAERDELGRVEWVATIAPDATWTASVRFGVVHPKELTVVSGEPR